ncbi:MAG: (2Fe-2S)-binding protein [Bacteroidales bacterium]|nr:(2Fe-2S)-binding protein [Bacteroidales bacterium]
MTSYSQEIICQCNSITQAEILEAIRSKNLTTIPEIAKETAASTGCGRCRRIIRILLENEAK